MPYEMRALYVNFEVGQFVSPPRCNSDPNQAILKLLVRSFFEHANQRDNLAELLPTQEASFIV
jgi:hypothetical protein